MRSSLASLDRRRFDIVVVGGGINGAAAAQAAAAQGYAVALFEKGDFGSGSTARSSRLLHCGLRYLVPGGPLTTFLWHPDRFIKAVNTVRRSMEVRSDFVKTQPERVRKIRMHYPIYHGGPYAPWQVDSAFLLLRSLGEGGVPLDYERVSAKKALAELPFVPWLRDLDKLRAVSCYTEYQIDWPERVAVDMVRDAERLGCIARNYTPAVSIQRDGETWHVTLADAATGEKAMVSAPVVLNLAGIWVDDVNALTGQAVSPKITGTKGAHIIVKLPPECRGHGVAGVTRAGRPFYCMPWRDLHFFGPTETLYEGDRDAIAVDAADLEFLLAETNHLVPGLGITRDNVLSTWAGVRPLTYEPGVPMGARNRKIHDLSAEGLPGVFALTNGSLGAHRATGQDLVAAAARFAKPSGQPGILSRAALHFPENTNTARLDPDGPTTLADVRHAVGVEQARTLEDVLLRRTGLAWSADQGRAAALPAAEAMASMLGWDEALIKAEVAGYLAMLDRLYSIPGSGKDPSPVATGEGRHASRG
ncbi:MULTISPECIES: FAD-dependent oxidoreductase [unclassified Chelatococcus]|uniref:FAD-dependent oxidoreductase n=2 Tax=Chelatococcus TaxID=28209 RepID=UPI001BD1BBC4|nr:MULTISPECIES: FAD-dependent oxidoreductase [unclassified Chelatococcus]CAH1662959.1 Glycerol-3-phosphate dehydrogenase [Hyphomicrobiales bacterium]MBS7741507.1 FAD-dependent oxidoreductase [Chelatococcus sp. HY11]MBX3544474.1 FAD-dependent oxidoreductase [Chelatococcus sp.]MCO5079003.1 FAD-dependent oxidoreductase [Chelatococcus sp.]CAH1682451.1 Glycerol-3-phosphate dehydrogenase [Hyphomicrobiales bacterium]